MPGCLPRPSEAIPIPYNAEPGEVAYVVASKQLTHGAIATDQGFAGEAVKTQTPSAETPRNQRNIILAGESYLLLIGKIVEAPASALAGVAKGTLVYIAAADNSLSTTSGAGKLALGKVSSLPGERGTPSNLTRINQRQKVA